MDLPRIAFRERITLSETGVSWVETDAPAPPNTFTAKQRAALFASQYALVLAQQRYCEGLQRLLRDAD